MRHSGISKFSWRFTVYIFLLLSFMVFIFSLLWYLDQGIHIPGVARTPTNISFSGHTSSPTHVAVQAPVWHHSVAAATHASNMQELNCRIGMPCAWMADGHIESVDASNGVWAHWHVKIVHGKWLLLVPRTDQNVTFPFSSSPKEIVLLVKHEETWGWLWHENKSWRLVRLSIS